MGALQVAVAGATIVLALMAIVTAGASYFLLRANTDPHVIVFTHHDNDRPTIIELVIENIGKGVAYDVRFELDRPIPAYAPGITPTGEKKDWEPMCEGPLIRGIPALAPGESRVITWGQYGGIRDALESRSVRVITQFSSRRSHAWDPTDHSVESIIEVSSFEATDASESEDSRQTKELAKISRDMHRLADAVTNPLYKRMFENRLRESEEKAEAAAAKSGGEP